MQLSKGVEWSVHACVLLAALPEDKGLSAEALARYHDVPGAYMAKQMQALSRAGLVRSMRGAGGGYRLAKAPDQITLWDITAAVEGSAPAFRCSEVRQNGPCGSPAERCKTPCPIAASFHAAEKAFRDILSNVTIADIALRVVETSPPEHTTNIFNWIGEQG